MSIKLVFALCGLLLANGNLLGVEAGVVQLFTIHPVEIGANENIVSLPGKERSFVVNAMIYFHAISQGKDLPPKDAELLRQALKDLRACYDASPSSDDFWKYREDHIARYKQLRKDLGNEAGSRVYTIERDKDMADHGFLISVEMQQAAVWKIIDSLEGKLSKFKEFKQGFTILALERTGPALFASDPYIAARLSLNEKDVVALKEKSNEALSEYRDEVAVAKRSALTEVWNVLRDKQKERFCRLYGKTERVFLLEASNSTAAALCQDFRAKEREDIFKTYDAFEGLIRAEAFRKAYNSIVGFENRNKILTEEQLAALSKAIQEALEGDRARFQNEEGQKKWLAPYKALLEPFINQLRKDSREPAKVALENLAKLLDEISEPREFGLVLENLRPKVPMIYYMEEFDRLDDTFEQKKYHLRTTYPGRSPRDNCLPFYPMNPGDGGDGTSEDAIIAQYRDAMSLADRWAKDRAEAADYSELVEINNRYLKEAKDVMLPFQYPSTFRQFLDQNGLVLLFHYHDVAQDFGMSNLQRNRLRDIGKQAADTLESQYHEICRACLAKVVDQLMEKKASQFESIFGVDRDDLLDVLLLPINEDWYPRLLYTDPPYGFSIYRDYEHPFDSGVSY